MPDTLAAEVLRLCVSWASETTAEGAADHVRSALALYVQELRDAGLPIEKTIVSVKRVAADAGLRPSSDFPLGDADLPPNDRLLVDLVRWTVLHYYAQPGNSVQTT